MSLAMKTALPDKAIEGALRRAKGLITFAAWDLGVAPELLRARVEGTLWDSELLDEMRDELTDEALWKIIQRMKAGDVRAAIWWLERFGEDRGYGRHRPTFEVLATPDKRALIEELADLLSQTKGVLLAAPGSASRQT